MDAKFCRSRRVSAMTCSCQLMFNDLSMRCMQTTSVSVITRLSHLTRFPIALQRQPLIILLLLAQVLQYCGADFCHAALLLQRLTAVESVLGGDSRQGAEGSVQDDGGALVQTLQMQLLGKRGLSLTRECGCWTAKAATMQRADDVPFRSQRTALPRWLLGSRSRSGAGAVGRCCCCNRDQMT